VTADLHCLLDEATIGDRVASLAATIDGDYAATDLMVLVGVLKGSFIFLADLARRLTVPHRVEFIAVSSYGDRESEDASGAVRLLMDVRHDLGGADVLIVEDIIDTGHTAAYLLHNLTTRNPASVKLCSLLHKPARTQVKIDIDYLGFEVPDKFVVGYGLDIAQQYRNLPFIGYVPQE
jgi:hypoxanthine phosphoribosyltransferase